MVSELISIGQILKKRTEKPSPRHRRVLDGFNWGDNC